MAATFGISLNSASNEESIVITKRERRDPTADARRSVDEFIAMVREADAIDESGGTVDPSMAIKIMERLSSLNADETEILIIGLLNESEFSSEYREAFIPVAMLKLANDDPPSALKLLPKLGGVVHNKDQKLSDAVLNTSLTAWSRENPAAAAAWVRENATRFSETLTESTKCGILSGAVAVDPALAFKLIDELEIKDSGKAVASIARAAKTTQERSATLTALRMHLSTMTDEGIRRDTSRAAVQELAFGSYKTGFDATKDWLAVAKLSPAEADAFITTLAYSNVKGDTVKWIDWIGENLSANQANDRISLLVMEWTQADYQAVGKWLSASPDGSVKNAAIPGYASTVSKYEPEAATQWAMTLPAGKDREWTLGQIYQNWPTEDAPGKEAFAKEHKIPAR